MTEVDEFYNDRSNINFALLVTCTYNLPHFELTKIGLLFKTFDQVKRQKIVYSKVLNKMTKRLFVY